MQLKKVFGLTVNCRFFSSNKGCRGLLGTAKVLRNKGDIVGAKQSCLQAIKQDPSFKEAYDEYFQLALVNNQAFGPQDQSLQMLLDQYNELCSDEKRVTVDRF